MTSGDLSIHVPASPEAVRKLVQRWQDGEVDERQVHEAAEAMYDSYGQEPPMYLDDDPRSITLEVVCELSILNHQLIARADIPAILAFLATPKGEELLGWSRWRAYWDAVDFAERAHELAGNSYYTSTD